MYSKGTCNCCTCNKIVFIPLSLQLGGTFVSANARHFRLQLNIFSDFVFNQLHRNEKKSLKIYLIVVFAVDKLFFRRHYPDWSPLALLHQAISILDQFSHECLNEEANFKTNKSKFYKVTCKWKYQNKMMFCHYVLLI